jgi:hypothetical protein
MGEWEKCVNDFVTNRSCTNIEDLNYEEFVELHWNHGLDARMPA